MNIKQPANPLGLTTAKPPKTTDRQATAARMFHTAQAKSKQQFNMSIHLPQKAGQGLSLKEQPI